MAHKDFATSTVLTAPSPATSGTSLVVQSGHGARFDSSENFYATAHPEGTLPTVDTAEVVLVTAVSTDTFTITRAQLGSTAQSIEAGWRITAALYAGEFDGKLDNVVEDTTPQLGGELDAQGNNITDTGDITFKTGATGGTLRTGTSNADKFELQAYDVDGSAYQKVLEVDAGNSPTLEVFTDTFRIWDSTDETKRLKLDASAIGTGTTRTLSMPNADVDLADFETTTELNARDTANRSRTNHTGTQPASTISDFDTEVSNNATVTSKITGDGTAKLTTGATAPTSPADGDLWVDTDEDDNTNLLNEYLAAVATGWFESPSLTFSAFNSTTRMLTLTGTSLTDTFTNGNRLKFTDAGSGLTYGIVHKVEATTLHVFIENGKTPTGAVSGVSYSTQYSPQGFDADSSKWVLRTIHSSNSAQNTPATNSWYNIASISLALPAGAWRLRYHATISAKDTTAAAWRCYVSLSTSASSVSDSEFTHGIYFSSMGEFLIPTTKEKQIATTTDTTYYMIIGGTTGTDSIAIRGDGDFGPTIVEAVCAYV